MEIFRKEHPKPQFERESWLNLNGEWEFEIDNAKSGEARGLQKPENALKDKITVPFCPESRLSGIGNTDFLNAVWYKRKFNLDNVSGRGMLRFGAVDYKCRAFVNGAFVGEHKGGYVSFGFDVTNVLKQGENTVTVYAEDDSRDGLIPSGKQSDLYSSYGACYTRTTGIWQTVWLEFLPDSHLKGVKYYPNVTDGTITVEADLCGIADFGCEILFNGDKMGSYTAANAKGRIVFTVPLAEKHLWEVGKGNLYDVYFTFGEDRVKSYFGLREVMLDGHKFLINGKSVFQRLVLDQGFYPDGIYTAPSDEALENDIKLSVACGFNGARLHEKVFEERFLYHADKMGYIVWGEYPDWGLDHTRKDSIYPIMNEWIEEINRDFNHPAIVGWIPHNETWDKNHRKQFDEGIRLLYRVTKAIDSTRPCVDTSGGMHVETDIYDVHDYNQDPASFKADYDKLMTDGSLHDVFSDRQTYRGEAAFVSEYGGIAWNNNGNGWGYGNTPKTIEEFYERFKGLSDTLLDNNEMFGLCYTQLTDVEQEQNGLYTYDRKPKFDTERLYKVLRRKAAIEDFGLCQGI